VDGWGVMCLIVCFMFELVFWFMFWPRTNYRRDVSSGVVLFVWCSVLVDGCWWWRYWCSCLSWCLRLSWWMVFYIIIYYYTLYILYIIIYIIISYTILYYTILYYTILYYTLLFFCLYSSLLILLFSSSSVYIIRSLSYLLPFFSSSVLYSLPLLFYTPLFLLPNPLIHSILVGTWIHIFIFQTLLPFPNHLLTPHVLSEWMVEVWCV
jgi:hypothetical protein